MSLGKDIFPNIQSKPPLTQLEAIAFRPITSYLAEETNPRLTTASFQAVVESDKVPPQPLLQTEQSQFLQPLLIRLVLQTLHQPCCSSLDRLQPLNVLLVVGGPKVNTVSVTHVTFIIHFFFHNHYTMSVYSWPSCWAVLVSQFKTAEVIKMEFRLMPRFCGQTQNPFTPQM